VTTKVAQAIARTATQNWPWQKWQQSTSSNKCSKTTGHDKQQLNKTAVRARSPDRDKNSNWQGQKCNNQLAGSKKWHQQLMAMKESKSATKPAWDKQLRQKQKQQQQSVMTKMATINWWGQKQQKQKHQSIGVNKHGNNLMQYQEQQQQLMGTKMETITTGDKNCSNNWWHHRLIQVDS